MSYTKIDIANMALAHLGKPEILSLSDTSTESRTANFWYDKAAGSALRRSNWTFSRAILTLTEMTNDYEERWAYKYDYPSTAKKIVRLIPSVDSYGTENAMPLQYQLLGGAIYCNERQAKADIVTALTTPTNWPDDFAFAVSHQLARLMAPKLTRKASYANENVQLYEMYLGMAIEADSAQEPTFYAYSSQYLDDRGADGPDMFGEGRNVDGSIYWD